MTRSMAFTTSPVYAALSSAAGAGRVATSTIRHVGAPGAWWRTCVVELALAVQRCLLPLVLSVTVFAIGAAVILAAQLLQTIGTLDRYGGVIAIAAPRESAVWISTMVIAGVAGSGMCADIAARKVREELDALGVLGVDVLPSLIVPRVMALTLAAPLLGLVALLTWHVVGFVTDVTTLGQPAASYLTSAAAFTHAADVLAFMVKLTVIGFFVGVVACTWGLAASGGPEGVGRAVASTVLITYLGIWIFNAAFNLAFFTLFPEVQVLR